MSTLNIINLTPHTVNLFIEGNELCFPSEGIARVSQKVEKIAKINHIQFTKNTFGEVTGLPEEKDNTLIIVSRMVANALPTRADLIVPNETVLDEKGRVIGCKSFESPNFERMRYRINLKKKGELDVEALSQIEY